MFRKLLLASVTSVGLLSPLAVASPASAHEYRHEYRHHVASYRVFYRGPGRAGWVCGGTFRSHGEAVHFAEGYRCRGFTISIR